MVNGQQLWAEACSLGSPDAVLGDIGMQQYIAALGHVRFVACAVHAALCCGATSAPSVEAELCRTLAQCEEAWQHAIIGEAVISLERLLTSSTLDSTWTSSLCPALKRRSAHWHW